MRSLVVDDEFVALSKMNLILSDYGTCDAATHSEQAWAFFEKAVAGNTPYDLITLDIRLPGQSGVHLLHRICAEERRQGIPRARKLMVSGDSSYHNVVAAAAKACDGFLVKPVRRDVLVDRLRKLGLIDPEAAAEEAGAERGGRPAEEDVASDPSTDGGSQLPMPDASDGGGGVNA